MKRPAQYVPAEYRPLLNALSKADLMEVAFSLAMRAEEDDYERAYRLVVAEHSVLARQFNRRPVALT